MDPPPRPMLRCAWITALILSGGALAAAQGVVEEASPNPRAFARPDASTAPRAEETGPPPIVLEPTYIFRGPIDPETIRERLARPDLVILGLDEYERLKGSSDALLAPPQPPEAVVEAVRLRGEVADGLVRLSVEYDIHVASREPVWVPVRLDGLTVTSAVEEGRDLPLRTLGDAGESPGWEVQLEGRGAHWVEFGLLVPVRVDVALRRLEVPIRPAIATSLRLDVPPGAVEPLAGPEDALEVAPIDGPDGPRDRIRADGLTPRDVLAVTWRSSAGPDSSAPPLLAAQGDVALEVNRGVLLTRSTWSIRCIRGAARTLELHLDDRSDELLTVELDERTVPVGEAFDPDSGRLTVELPEPLRADDEPRRLALTTRRSLPTEISARFRFRGFRLENAAEQSGVIALVQGEDLWVTATAGRGLRQINPLTDLPESLRTRPKVVLAYRFIEQPFDLQIRSDPAPPTAQVEVRSTIAIDGHLARVETELEYAVGRGRFQEVRVGIPEGLELVAVGPESVVESSRALDEEEVDAESPSGRTLLVRLAERARAAGSTFRLRLSGRQAIDPGDAVRVGLFRPIDGVLRNRRLAVLAAPAVSVELAEGGEGGPFRPIAAELSPDWPRPADPVASGMLRELWLWTDLNVRHVALDIATRDLDLHHETIVQAEVDLRRCDLRQETTCHVLQGVLDQVEVCIPPELEGRWELDGDEVVTREPLGIDADGSVRYRLILGRRAIDLLRLRFLARLPLDPRLSAETATALRIPWIRVLTGSAAPTQVDVAADPGIRLEPEGSGWLARTEAAPGAGPVNSPPVRWSWTGPDDGGAAPEIKAVAPAPIDLPPLLASRLWIRTHEGLDGERRSTAWYRVESHQGSFSVALPPGSELVRAQVGHDAVEPERVRGGIRLRLPTEFSGELLVRLDYRSAPAVGEPGGWQPPRMLDGGTVQETLWEVYIPWSRAVVGTPRSWIDENQWYWGGYVWKRRPGLSPRELAEWAASPAVRGQVEESDPGARWGGYHGYLFGRFGEPMPLDPTISSRALLVALCSGLALALGVLLLILEAPARLVVLCGVGSVLALGAVVWPDVALLAVQSAAAGILLTALAAAIQQYVDLRRSARIVFGEASQVSELGSGVQDADFRGSSREAAVAEPGSDESTVVRRRPPTTIDYVPTSPRQPGGTD